MMDPAVKTALAFCVLLAGVCAAMLFPHDRPRLVFSSPDIEEDLLLRYRVTAPVPSKRSRDAGHWASASGRSRGGAPSLGRQP